jgi:hypothetical protein
MVEELRDANTTLTGLAAGVPMGSVNVLVDGDAQMATGYQATGNYFSVISERGTKVLAFWPVPVGGLDKNEVRPTSSLSRPVAATRPSARDRPPLPSAERTAATSSASRSAAECRSGANTTLRSNSGPSSRSRS